MPSSNAVRRAAQIERIIPAPPPDILPLREAFSGMVSAQWQAYVPTALAKVDDGLSTAQTAKARFIGEMYARACYSMMVVSSSSPVALHFPVRMTGQIPVPRSLTIRLARIFLSKLDHLVPAAVHRQLLSVSALMGRLDVVLDEAAILGEAAVLRVSSLVTDCPPPVLGAAEKPIWMLAQAARFYESAWQTAFWKDVLEPAVRRYCIAESKAVNHVPGSGIPRTWRNVGNAHPVR